MKRTFSPLPTTKMATIHLLQIQVTWVVALLLLWSLPDGRLEFLARCGRLCRSASGIENISENTL